ncbi:unnamed protein product [Protopolystoma xenopodis]|uniref:Uncharacterized protein n=1 Tax=Protopolystoma xenopodis TaxID=117903 RepID=A0A448XD61_9PLAT|nr:unnamed protein product [Protopolystoma xenopodis]
MCSFETEIEKDTKAENDVHWHNSAVYFIVYTREHGTSRKHAARFGWKEFAASEGPLSITTAPRFSRTATWTSWTLLQTPSIRFSRSGCRDRPFDHQGVLTTDNEQLSSSRLLFKVETSADELCFRRKAISQAGNKVERCMFGKTLASIAEIPKFGQKVGRNA